TILKWVISDGLDVELGHYLWDLRFSFVAPPATVRRCQPATWQVRVANAGNQPSPTGIGARTAISLTPGTAPTGFEPNGNRWWSNCILLHNASVAGVSPPVFTAPVLNWLLPSIPAGSAMTFTINVGQLDCGAFLGTQDLEAGIDYCSGYFDNCTTGN